LFERLFPANAEVFPKDEPADVQVERHHRGLTLAAVV
jgi:hypothetical protein